MKYEIYKDCKWYQRRNFSVGNIDWCVCFEEEKILGINDCRSCACGNYETKTKRFFPKPNL